MKRRMTLHKRPRARPIHRVGAPLLLAVLLGGLGVMTITSDWVGRLPFHDHLILGLQHHSPAHHAHKGDELDRAFAALTVVASPELAATAAIPAAGQRVISLAPMSATQVELSTVSLVAGAIGAIGCLHFARGRRLVVADSPCPAGHLPGLPSPPPRPI